MATYEVVSYRSPDGAKVGASSAELIGFWGVTPVVQQSSASQAAVTTEAAQTIAGSNFGFTSAQANGIITLLNRLRLDLVTTGIILGS